MAPVLSVKGLTLRRDNGKGSAIFHDIHFDVNEGDVLMLRGKSGSGKTTLLKCLAELNVYHAGEIKFHGKSPSEYGIPNYRTRVLYIPQRPSLLPGTPRQFLSTILSFAARRGPKSSNSSSSKAKDVDLPDLSYKLATDWGIEPMMWDREWGVLSGGEGQRVALAIAVGLSGAEVILLDEPTSALDETNMKKVEQSLLDLLPNGANPSPTLKAIVWITHEESQASRVGTRTFDITHPDA